MNLIYCPQILQCMHTIKAQYFFNTDPDHILKTHAGRVVEAIQMNLETTDLVSAFSTNCTHECKWSAR